MNRPKENKNPNQLRFLTSAVDLKGCPADKMPEVALVGRSNAGKSSLINGMAKARIAQTSSTPGKTRLLNFYEGPSYRYVDMPGYGFAARAGKEQLEWQKFIEPYLGTRGNLTGLVIVMDIRRDWTDDEKNLVEWMKPRDLPTAVALTKTDKISRGEALQRQEKIKKASGLDAVMLTSSLAKQGFEELELFIYHSWIVPLRSRGSRK